MNAGAYGRELKDVLLAASAMDGHGKQIELSPDELDLGYRHCAAPEDWIFLGAELRGRADTTEAVAARIATIQEKRQATQPVRSRTGGSTFANPPGERAWELVDRAGCRGLRRGGAMVSELHTNFLINIGDATAADLEGLGEEVRRRVFENSGIRLDWEIKRIGIPLREYRGGPNMNERRHSSNLLSAERESYCIEVPHEACRGPDGRLVGRARGLAVERSRRRRSAAPEPATTWRKSTCRATCRRWSRL